MKVTINGRFLSRQPTGVDRVAIETTYAINELVASNHAAVQNMSFRLLLPPGTQATHVFEHVPATTVGTHGGQLWEQWDLPRAAGDSLLVNLCNTAPVLRRHQVAVIHDAATVRVPQSYGRAFRAWYSVMVPTLYKRSVSVCTVSQFSRQDLADLYGPRADVCVLPEGTDHMDRVAADASVLHKHALTQRPYVLAVSSLAPHKNFAAVVRAVELMGDCGFDIAIAGGQNPKVFAGSANPLPSSVKYVGYVTDGELKALYENAACFVFPSIYEGYGLPPTEAMACGCPVIAAYAASIPEVCSDAALYFDPHKPADLADQLKHVMNDAALRATLRERGRTHAGAMRWRNTALALLNEIKRVSH